MDYLCTKSENILLYYTLMEAIIYFHRIGPLGRFDLVVAMSVCLMFLFMWYILRPILPQVPEVGCPKFSELLNLRGKGLERSGLRFEYFIWEVVLNRRAKKKFVSCWFCLTKHGGNHASRWSRDLWSKGISQILHISRRFWVFEFLVFSVKF